MRAEHSEVRTKKTEGDILPVRSRASLVNKRCITRLKKTKAAKTQVRDHSGQCPAQYLENIGPAIEHFDWLILVIGPLTSCGCFCCSHPGYMAFMNDLPNCLKFTTPCLYADDTQIFTSSSDISVLANNINSDLKNLGDWLTVNKLQFHPLKIFLILLGQHTI